MIWTDLTPQFNEWPNELAKEVMESIELEHAAWSPTERCNFCAHLAATRVSVNIFEFEMNPTFRTALPAFFFSWWLYMMEVVFLLEMLISRKFYLAHIAAVSVSLPWQYAWQQHAWETPKIANMF